MAKIAVRICVDGAENMQSVELLKKAQKYIPRAYAGRQMRTNNTEAFAQLASQRDTALNLMEI